MAQYIYTKALPILVPRLISEIEVALGKKPTRVGATAAQQDNLEIVFAEELTPEEQSALAGIVVAHTGQPYPAFHYCASSHMLQDATVTEDQDWQELGGTVTTITSFVADPTKGWGRITMQVKATGTGGQLNVVRHSDGVSCMAAPYAVPDTQGVWINVSFWINQNQPSGIEAFVLQGRRNGASALEVRWVSISLLEKVQ